MSKYFLYHVLNFEQFYNGCKHWIGVYYCKETSILYTLRLYCYYVLVIMLVYEQIENTYFILNLKIKIVCIEWCIKYVKNITVKLWTSIIYISLSHVDFLYYFDYLLIHKVNHKRVNWCLKICMIKVTSIVYFTELLMWASLVRIRRLYACCTMHCWYKRIMYYG